jgi:UDP-N-acetylmuramoyl-L-alanyl-D-glutamate--2,6-diaminopimelate ligase
MKLQEILTELPDAQILGDRHAEVSALAYDSREVVAGTLFFCVPGATVDGHEFAAAAVAAGAVAVVVERELALGAETVQVLVGDARAAMAPVAARFWGDPSGELALAGVTGTNGKTTTAYLIREILERAGVQCGLLGTVKQVVAGEEEEVERTTPEAIDLQASFRRMVVGGDRACAMEVSSHAMALHRCDSIHFEVALFLNLSRDHLDFHGSMEAYFRSKRSLFEGDPATAIINVDDAYGRRLASEFAATTLSVHGGEADFVAEEISYDAGGATFWINGPTGRCRLAIALPGYFNVANALAAFAAALALGVDAERASAALAGAARVPGRFEPVQEGQRFAVLIDYAHTPDSLENVLRAARALSEARVISVFGAGGDRDRGKRPKMGRAAAAHSDLTIVTSDNPRSESPEQIAAEITAGIGRGAEVAVELDRRAAIALALSSASPGDVVVIAGKGHERGQEFAGQRKVPFDDREVAAQELRRLAGAA